MDQRIEKLLRGNISKENLDEIMKELLTEKFDEELKNKYNQKLSEEYNIDRSISNIESSLAKNKQPRKFIVVIIGLAFVLSTLLYFATQSLNNYENKVQNYLAENSMDYHGISRSETEQLYQLRFKAFEAVNQKDFITSKRLFEQMESLNSEDQFYYAYSLLNIKDLKRAKIQFTLLQEKLSPKDPYYQETLFYNSLTEAALSKNKDEIKRIISSLEKDSWERNEMIKVFE